MALHTACAPSPLGGAASASRSSTEAAKSAASLCAVSPLGSEWRQGSALHASSGSVQTFLAYEVSRECRMTSKAERTSSSTPFSSASSPTHAGPPNAEANCCAAENCRSVERRDQPPSSLLASRGEAAASRTELNGGEEESEVAANEEELAETLSKAKDIVARLAAARLGVEADARLLEAEAVEVGSTNRMVHVWSRRDPKKSCAVKFFGKHTGKYICRDKELRLLRLLGANDVGKEIFATFEEGGGGLIESWLAGSSLEPSDLHREAAKIAGEMARMHAIDAKPQCLLVSPTSRDSRGELAVGETPPSPEATSDLWKHLFKFLNLCKEEQERARRGEDSEASSDGCEEPSDCPKRTVFSRRILLFDLRTVEERLRQLHALASEVQSPVVLCHGDLLSGNIIKTDEGDVRFIDFDYSGFMERGFDIANHFAEYSGVECDFSRCPSEEERDAFLRTYLRALRRQRERRAKAVAAETQASAQPAQDEDLEAEVAALRREINVFFPLSNILWGLWALIQAVHVKPREMNYWRFAFDRLAAAVVPPVPHLSF
ncbi:UNVERIFIED_CONTAM: phosphotransferase enzyme family protein [Hammondia hammondi]|eukprot:XP_008884903.1 phosphotransferase enzyme family protein [Hammondia hammondi]